MNPAWKQPISPCKIAASRWDTDQTMQKQEQKAKQEATEAEKVVWLRLGYQKLDFGRKVFIKKKKPKKTFTKIRQGSIYLCP